jgi:hypothetical protein
MGAHESVPKMPWLLPLALHQPADTSPHVRNADVVNSVCPATTVTPLARRPKGMSCQFPDISIASLQHGQGETTQQHH